MAGESLQGMILELIRVRALAKRYEDRKKELERSIPELMVEQGVDSIKTSEGPIGFIKKGEVKLKAWPNTEKGLDKLEANKQFHDALREAGAEHLINDEPRVANASLCAWVKEQMREGNPIPDAVGYSLSPSFAVRTNGWSPDNV